jgi:hypothetical protein
MGRHTRVRAYKDSEAFLHVQASLRQRHSMSQIAGEGARGARTSNRLRKEVERDHDTNKKTRRAKAEQDQKVW